MMKTNVQLEATARPGPHNEVSGLNWEKLAPVRKGWEVFENAEVGHQPKWGLNAVVVERQDPDAAEPVVVAEAA